MKRGNFSLPSFIAFILFQLSCGMCSAQNLTQAFLDSLNTGIYFSFEDFKNNTPAQDLIFEMDSVRRMNSLAKKGYRLKFTFEKKELSSSKIVAFKFNNKVYYRAVSDFLPLRIVNEKLSFTARITIKTEDNIGPRRYSNQIYFIDMETGNAYNQSAFLARNALNESLEIRKKKKLDTTFTKYRDCFTGDSIIIEKTKLIKYKNGKYKHKSTRVKKPCFAGDFTYVEINVGT